MSTSHFIFKIKIGSLASFFIYFLLCGNICLEAKENQNKSTASIVDISKNRAPVFFVHGLLVSNTVYKDVIPLKSVFKKNGYELYLPERDQDMTIEERAEVLYEEINKIYPAGKFHIIGHSAGGIDARFALWKYKDLAKRCLSLTTMASPHWGSPVADDIIVSVDSENPSLSGGFFKFLFDKIPNARQLTYEMTTEFMHSFNTYVEDDTHVRYFSIGFYIEQPFYLFASPVSWNDHLKLLSKGIELNDGPVPLASSIWGEMLPSMPGDHFSETSQIQYGKKEIFQDIFSKLLQNLDKNF